MTTAQQTVRSESGDTPSLQGFGLEDGQFHASDTRISVPANEIGASVAIRNRSTKAKRPGRHMTITELCEDLGIARSTFYDWRAKHKAPPCFKLPNGDLRIRRTDYEEWLASLEEER